MKSKLIIFDIDDTLYNEIDYVKSGYKFVSKYIEEKYNKKNIYNLLLELFKESPRNVFNRLFEKLNIDYKNDDIMYLVNLYRNHMPNIRMSIETINVLEKLRKKYNLAVVSDGNYNTQKMKCEALGLSDYFDKIILTDKYGKEYWKPNKKAFELLKDEFDIDYEEMLYIGDNPNKDFYLSVYGIKTVRLYNKKGIYYYDGYKDSIKEICSINVLNDILDVLKNEVN